MADQSTLKKSKATKITPMEVMAASNEAEYLEPPTKKWCLTEITTDETAWKKFCSSRRKMFELFCWPKEEDIEPTLGITSMDF